MKPDLGKLLEQAQRMQAQLQQAQAELRSIEVIGEAGGGMVRVHMNARHEVRRVRIEPAALAEEAGMLEDLVAAACNDAARKAQEAAEAKLGSVAGGMGLPPGLKLPF